MNLCVIPARGGSTRIPRKNVRLFHGKPIIAYSIEAAQATGLFERVIVSTDDGEISNIASSFMAQIHRRPKELAADNVGTLEVVGDVARKFAGDGDYVCCLYATAPMVRPADIVGARSALINWNATHCVSVGAFPLRDAAQFYWSNGDAAKGECNYYEFATIVEVVAENRICDINVESDWLRAEAMYAALHPEVA